MNDLWMDLRFGLRSLRKSPGFTLVAILTLALGIGANTAIFSVINTVLLQPLPYPQPDRIVALVRAFPQGRGISISIPKFMVWHKQTRVFQAVTAYDFAGPGMNLTGGDLPELVKGIHASADYFAVFGAPVAIGRTFSMDEDRPGGPHVAVMSNGLWRSHFGSDPNIVGKTIELGGDPYEVIGVLGAGFSSRPNADIWLPLQADPNSINQGHYLNVAARLRPGVSLNEADSAMKLAVEEFRRKFPGLAGGMLDPKESAAAIPLRDTLVENVKPALLILSGAVVFVLLIACANVANLMLVRATLRSREIAIRAALGAGRRRIMWQLLTESLLLSLAGGALGLAVGYVGVRALLATNPGNIPRIGQNGSSVVLDWRVLLFTATISIVTGILFGLIPALNISRADLSLTLKESGTRSGSGLRHKKARAILVVTEISLALILLVGAGLLIRTFAAMHSVNPGFDTHNVLTMDMSLSGTRFEKTSAMAQVVSEVERRVGSLPGVSAVATTCCVPLQDENIDLPFVINAHPPTDGPFSGDTQWRNVSPGYFDVFRIPLLRGRLFTDRDDANSELVVVINQAMAKKFWPKENPVGVSITIGKGISPEFNEPARQVIGIIGDTKDLGLNNDAPPMMYVPTAQVTDGLTALEHRVAPVTWAVRTNTNPYSLSASVQQELRIASGGLAVRTCSRWIK